MLSTRSFLAAIAATAFALAASSLAMGVDQPPPPGMDMMMQPPPPPIFEQVGYSRTVTVIQGAGTAKQELKGTCVIPDSVGTRSIHHSGFYTVIEDWKLENGAWKRIDVRGDIYHSTMETTLDKKDVTVDDFHFVVSILGPRMAERFHSDAGPNRDAQWFEKFDLLGDMVNRTGHDKSWTNSEYGGVKESTSVSMSWTGPAEWTTREDKREKITWGIEANPIPMAPDVSMHLVSRTSHFDRVFAGGRNLTNAGREVDLETFTVLLANGKPLLNLKEEFHDTCWGNEIAFDGTPKTTVDHEFWSVFTRQKDGQFYREDISYRDALAIGGPIDISRVTVNGRDGAPVAIEVRRNKLLQLDLSWDDRGRLLRWSTESLPGVFHDQPLDAASLKRLQAVYSAAYFQDPSWYAPGGPSALAFPFLPYGYAIDVGG